MAIDHPPQPPLSLASYEQAVSDELQFLDAWEKGHVPVLSAVVRIRQIRRANLLRLAQGNPPLDS